jgi:hypothetical protein
VESEKTFELLMFMRNFVFIRTNLNQNQFTQFTSFTFTNHLISHQVINWNSSSSYCSERVRKCDYMQYACALLLPSETRRGIMALRALNIEVRT